MKNWNKLSKKGKEAWKALLFEDYMDFDKNTLVEMIFHTWTEKDFEESYNEVHKIEEEE